MSKDSDKYSHLKQLMYVTATAVATVVAVFLGQGAYENSKDIYNKFTILSNYYRSSTDSLIVFRKSCEKNNKNYQLSSLTKVTSNLTKLINQVYDMGGLVSVKTYCSIRKYTKEINDLILKGSNPCFHLDVISKKYYDENQKILNNIVSDQKKHQGAISSIGNYFSNLEGQKYRSTMMCPTDKKKT